MVVSDSFQAKKTCGYHLNI